MKTQVCRLCQQVCMSMSVCMGGEIFFFGGGVYVEVKDVKVFSFFYVLLMELNIGVFSS